MEAAVRVVDPCSTKEESLEVAKRVAIFVWRRRNMEEVMWSMELFRTFRRTLYIFFKY